VSGFTGTGPPEKGEARGKAGFPEPPRFLSMASCQSSVWAGWQKHALWILAGYSRTGDFKHLLAFVRQVRAMRERLQ